MRVLLADCKDSFTFNLARTTERVLKNGDSVTVVRTDGLVLGEAKNYDKFLLSPGPGVPSETENLMELIAFLSPTKPFLGVCLGHQALAEAFGGKLVNLPEVFHGVKSSIRLAKEAPVFAGLPETIEAGRYHSWAVSPEDFPESLRVTATDDEGRIMAFSHDALDVHGVQFHPESILTPFGPKILENFLYGGRP
ncbi:MAG: aminodeoxychorismate/anthranilate synthase component II [Deltaproteobacteria bacterium]|nr:aminodeoxychorismate/anthranilate synthase component II [Deltaproteobacteria bacterium]